MIQSPSKIVISLYCIPLSIKQDINVKVTHNGAKILVFGGKSKMVYDLLVLDVSKVKTFSHEAPVFIHQEICATGPISVNRKVKKQRQGIS